MNRQSVIPATSGEDLTFDGFHVGTNRALVKALESAAGGAKPGAVIFFWGPRGSGKSHLLTACCRTAEGSGRAYRYVSGGSPLPSAGPGVIVCLDDIGAEPVEPEREIGLLSLYELVQQCQGNLIVAAAKPPADLPLGSPDLVSRLASGGVFRLDPADDEVKRHILSDRARQRGFDLPEQVIDYIMRHHARDAASLLSLLDRLDHASLSQHRKITVPFLRDLLDG